MSADVLSFCLIMLLQELFILVSEDHGSHTGISEDLKQETMWNPSIKNMDSVDTVLYSRCTVCKLWQHTAADHTVTYQLLCARSCDPGNKAALVINIFV